MAYPGEGENDRPYRAQPPGALALEPKTFNENATPEIMLAYGEQYLGQHLSAHEAEGRPVPFCSTTDHIPVYFFDSAYHFLRRSGGGLLREVDRARIERLHWIRPILTGDAAGVILVRDLTGDEIGRPFRAGREYRVFWLPKRNYVLILDHMRRERAFKVLTAFCIDKPSWRSRYEALFPK
jgi:hypothetical protein